MAAVIMSGLLTQCAFLGIVRVAHVCNSAGLRTFYSSMLVVMGIVSLIVPAVFLLGVRNIKRAFAYSSVEHMGILVLGLALGGVGTIGAFFHVINNALSKTVMFLTAGSVAQKYGSSRVEELRGIVHAYPATGVFLIISALAGTGMFPFATFHSELMVLNAAISGKRFFLAAGFLACLAFIFIGMTRTVLQAVFGPPAEPVMPKRENSYMNAAIAAAAAVLLWFGVWMPAFLDRGIRAAASMIGG
jgi:hydrogenase-4 component F